MVKSNYFVGIGAAKTGTSWLADYLYVHPDVMLSPIKELHYFDARFCTDFCGHWNTKWLKILGELKEKNLRCPSVDLENKIRNVTFRTEMTHDPRIYKKYFDSHVNDKQSAFGEITPSYSILPTQGFSAIKKIYPQAKFIFLMRDPVSRYLSQIRFIRRLGAVEGKKPLQDFNANDTACECLSKPEYTLRGDYQRTIENLLQATSEDSICILFYEHLFDPDSQSKELEILCDFLGIQFRSSHSCEKINASHSFNFEEAVVAEVRLHFSSTYDFVDQRYGARAPRSWNWR